MKKPSPVKFVRAGLFGLIIIFFFLPFVVVSCPNNNNTVTLKGIDLVTGRTLSGRQFSAVTENQRIQPHLYAIVALGCAVAGVVFSLLKDKPAFILCLIAGGLGLLCVILLRGQIAAQAAAQAADGLRVTLSYRSGYWTTLAGFAAATLFTIVTSPYLKGKWKLKSPFRRRRR